jgi:GNAT superfamily N-acetyltransferase
MQILVAVTKQDKKEFIDFPKRLYKDDPCWVCPLDSVVESVFDPSVNHTFRHGEATRWILRDDSGTIIGRIAAFIDNVRSAANQHPTGGIGYFEVIDSQKAAFLLFDTAKMWLAERGMEAMDGPINFGENDNNWGLLVEGFMQQGYGMPYNKQYYRRLFEEYGFRTYFEQYSYHLTLREENNEIFQFPGRMMKIASWIAKRPGYSFSHFKIRNREKYINDIFELYNSTWSVFKEDFTPVEKAFLYESFEKTKAIIDEELIWFAYHNDRPISFFILFPDINQILKHFDGKLHLWNMIRFLFYKKSHEMTRLRAVAGGVHPSYQNSGVESAIFYHLYKMFKKKPWFREIELSWVGDYNPKMIGIFEALGSVKAKTHFTMRYLINDKITFRRYREEMEEKSGLK